MLFVQLRFSVKLVNLDWYWPILYMLLLTTNIIKWCKCLCHDRSELQFSLYFGSFHMLVGKHHDGHLLQSCLVQQRWTLVNVKLLPFISCIKWTVCHTKCGNERTWNIFLFFLPLMPVNWIRKDFHLSLTGNIHPTKLLLQGLGYDVTTWGNQLAMRAVRVLGVSLNNLSVHQANDKFHPVWQRILLLV